MKTVLSRLTGLFGARARAAEPARLSMIEPLNWRMADELAGRPALNIMLPWLEANMTGGPNTAVNLGCQVAARGIPVRLVSCDKRLPQDLSPVWNYIATLSGQARPANIELVSADDRSVPIVFGANDRFVATYFVTAHYIQAMAAARNIAEFFYLIQDFEPAFFEWSSRYAFALETYGWDFRALINQRFLADYLVEQRVGHFADPGFIDRCAVFDPAVDRRFFHPRAPSGRTGPRQLLFYARPFAGRNLFEVGHDALNLALRDPVLGGNEWEFLAIGGQGHVADMPLAGGRVLRAAPWRDYAGYAADLREADVLLSLMLSPHTSYPVLEMAACGGTVVTNAFSTKTEAGLKALSENIVVCRPTVDGVAAALVTAARRVEAGYDRDAGIAMPASWQEALAESVEMIAASMAQPLPASTLAD